MNYLVPVLIVLSILTLVLSSMSLGIWLVAARRSSTLVARALILSEAGFLLFGLISGLSIAHAVLDVPWLHWLGTDVTLIILWALVTLSALVRLLLALGYFNLEKTHGD